MSYSQIAESVIAKNAIKNEIKEVEDLLENVNREIYDKNYILNHLAESMMKYSLHDIRFCENRMKELIPKKEELEGKLDRLRNALSSINY